MSNKIVVDISSNSVGLYGRHTGVRPIHNDGDRPSSIGPWFLVSSSSLSGNPPRVAKWREGKGGRDTFSWLVPVPK